MGNQERRPHFELFPVRWLSLLFGTFAFAGYFPDLLRPHIPDVLAIGVMMLPLIIVVFIQKEEVSPRAHKITHLFAASLFLLLATAMEIAIYFGHRPKGLEFMRILAHCSWTLGWASIFKEAYRAER